MRYALGGLAGMVAGLAIAWVLWGARVPVEVCVDVARQVVATNRPTCPPPAPVAAQPAPTAAEPAPAAATPATR